MKHRPYELTLLILILRGYANGTCYIDDICEQIVRNLPIFEFISLPQLPQTESIPADNLHSSTSTTLRPQSSSNQP